MKLLVLDSSGLVASVALIEEILPDHYQKITIRKDLEKGFDYREIEMEEQ